MKRAVIILIAAAVLVSLCINVPVLAQDRGRMDEERIKQLAEKLGITPEEVKERMHQRQQGGGMEGRGGMAGGMQGRTGMAGMPMNRQMPEPQAQMLATEQYLFILKGNTVYQFDIHTLKLLNQAQIGDPHERNPQAKMEQRIKDWVNKTKEKIEKLRAEGNDAEADELEEMLKRKMEAIEKGRGKMKGWGKMKDKPKKEKPEEPHAEDDGLF